MPVVLVTHDLEEATMLADRLAVLHRGRILQTGTPEEVTTRPASPEVARLIDMRNVFEATVLGHEADRTWLDWAGTRLEAATRPDLAPGVRVPWAIPDGFVILHRRDRPSRGEHENPVRGTIGSMLVIGQTAHLTLRPDADPRLPIHFSVPRHVAARNGIAPGIAAAVSFLAAGIHVMSGAAGHSRDNAGKL
jgi:molybdate transport system ATP-binding protein